MRKLLLASAATMGALLATTGGALAQPVKPVAPGTIVVHLNGYFQFELANANSSDNTVNSATGAQKLNPVTTNGDFRFYPGFDAQTVNGIDYGVQVEIRTAFSDANQGAQSKTVVSGGSGSGTEGLYVKRAYGYIGAPEYGFVRLGQTDSAFTLTQTGVIEAFGDGSQFSSSDGNVAGIVPSDAAATSNFIYADQGQLYATNKVVYISPAFYGLSGIVGFEPNSNGLKEGYANNAAASDTSAALYATNNASNLGKRRRNTIDAGVLYVLKNNGVAYKASASYLYGQPLAYDGTTALTAAQKLDNLEIWQVGGQATYAGATLGVNVKGGQLLDSFAFKPVGTRDALAYIVSANYVIGPYVIGTNFFDSQSAGGYTPSAKGTEARTLSEYGLSVGGNYIIGKDLSLFVQYEYDHRHQPGNHNLDLNNLNGGNSQAQVIATGATFKW